jgi:GTPase SAR1 family protein
MFLDSYKDALHAKEEADRSCREDTPKILIGCKSDLSNHIYSFEYIKVLCVCVFLLFTVIDTIFGEVTFFKIEISLFFSVFEISIDVGICGKEWLCILL